MTAEQLDELLALSLWERTRKYLPMLQRGMISKRQYDWIMAAGMDVLDTPEKMAGFFGGRVL